MSQNHKKKHHGNAAAGAKEAQAALDRGRTLLAAGDAVRAVTELARAWAGQRSDAAREALITATRALAPGLVRARPADAVPLLARAHELASADGELAEWLAAAHWGAGDMDAAGRVLGTLMESRAGAPRHRLALALVRGRQGAAPTAAKLAADAGRALPGHRALDEAAAAEFAETRDVVRLALAAQVAGEGALAELSAEGVPAEERAAMVFSLTARQDAAVHWYTGAAGQALTAALAEARAPWAAELSAVVAPPAAPVPDVRGLLAHLADALEERLREASAPRASRRPRGWVSRSAQAVRHLRDACECEARDIAPVTDFPGAPRAVSVTLEAATRAAGGQAAPAFDALVAAAADLPRRALGALMGAILPRLEPERLTEALALALDGRLPELGQVVRSLLGYQALAARRFEDAARMFASLAAPAPFTRVFHAVALESLRRHEDALGIWRELLRQALERHRGGAEPLPVYTVTALERVIAQNRPDDDRTVRAALAALPARDDLWLYHIDALSVRDDAKSVQAARDLLALYRPARPQFLAARAIELIRLGGGAEVLRELADRTRGERVVEEKDRVRHALAVAGPHLAVDLAIALRMSGDDEDALEFLRAIPAAELARLPTLTALAILGELFDDEAVRDFDARLEAVLDAQPSEAARCALLLVLIVKLLEEYDAWGRPELVALAARALGTDQETPQVRNALRALHARQFQRGGAEFTEALRTLGERVRKILAPMESDDTAAQLHNRRALLAEAGTPLTPPEDPAPARLDHALAEALVSVAAHRVGLELD